MEETQTPEVLSKKIGEKVTVSGWVHDVRLLGGINFILVRNSEGIVQVTVPRKAVSKEVGLDNVFAHETSVTNLVRSAADVATARAVGRIDEVLGEAPFLKPGGLFLAWTTRATAGGLARRLGRHFSPDSQLAIPGSRHKVIAAFRKNVPRGTEE